MTMPIVSKATCNNGFCLRSKSRYGAERVVRKPPSVPSNAPNKTPLKKRVVCLSGTKITLAFLSTGFLFL